MVVSDRIAVDAVVFQSNDQAITIAIRTMRNDSRMPATCRRAVAVDKIRKMAAVIDSRIGAAAIEICRRAMNSGMSHATSHVTNHA